MIVTATTHAAERLAGDLQTWLGEGNAEVFPAWETLPFERVSPGVETMGRRAKLLWQLRTHAAPKTVIVPMRALLQRLSPSHRTIEPVQVRQGDQLVMDDFIADLVAQKKHSKELGDGPRIAALDGFIEAEIAAAEAGAARAPEATEALLAGANKLLREIVLGT